MAKRVCRLKTDDTPFFFLANRLASRDLSMKKCLPHQYSSQDVVYFLIVAVMDALYIPHSYITITPPICHSVCRFHVGYNFYPAAIS